MIKLAIKILVVDDKKDVRFTIEEALKAVDSNYEITQAESGDECIKLLSGFKPDLILLDIMMPGMDGSEVAIKIRENSETKNIPIIFLTAKTDALSKSMGEVVGNDYIEKPFDPVDLDQRIKVQLKR